MKMITRIWHGRTKKENAEIYKQYVVETGVRDYMEVQGNLDTRLLQRDDGDVTHIWMITLWQELECIQAFAGKNIEKARYYPEDEKFLLELEPNVLHCSTFLFSRSRINDFTRQLEQLYRGGSWNDENFTDKLKTIDEQKAFIQPIQGKHCIAELVWHCTYWQTVLLKQLQGDNNFKERTLNDQNFLSLESLHRKGWSNLLADLKESQESLISFLNTKNDNFLDIEYEEKKTFGYSIEGVIHHDIYHLGQIGLVISLLNK
jgi:uncharacterized damage-inducible protein DinB